MLADWSCIQNSNEIYEEVMEAKTVRAIYKKYALQFRES